MTAHMLGLLAFGLVTGGAGVVIGFVLGWAAGGASGR